MNVHWPQKVSNEMLYSQAQCPRATQVARHRRLRLYGQLRRGKPCPASLILQHPPSEKYRVGGHRRTTYESVIVEDLKLLGAPNADTNNKKEWDELCNTALT